MATKKISNQQKDVNKVNRSNRASHKVSVRSSDETRDAALRRKLKKSDQTSLSTAEDLSTNQRERAKQKGGTTASEAIDNKINDGTLKPGQQLTAAQQEEIAVAGGNASKTVALAEFDDGHPPPTAPPHRAPRAASRAGRASSAPPAPWRRSWSSFRCWAGWRCSDSSAAWGRG